MAARPRLVKITRERGRWLAHVEDQWLPVLHERHWNFHTHSDHAPLPPRHRGTQRCVEWLAALQAQDRAVMPRDAAPPPPAFWPDRAISGASASAAS